VWLPRALDFHLLQLKTKCCTALSTKIVLAWQWGPSVALGYTNVNRLT